MEGELHVELPAGDTMPYGGFMHLRAAHLHCCEECSTKRLIWDAWRIPQINTKLVELERKAAR